MKTIKTKKEFYEKAKKKGLNISDWARKLIEKADIKPSEFESKTIKVSELGFEEYPKYKDIIAKAKEQGLEVMSHAEALTFALENNTNDYIIINCEPITDSSGFPDVFRLARDDDGLWLDDYWARPDREWDPSNEFVFRLRKPLEIGKLNKDQDRKYADIILSRMKSLEAEKKSNSIPMGVSQWREYGKKYGYHEFFEAEIREEIFTKLHKYAVERRDISSFILIEKIRKEILLIRDGNKE